MRNLHGPSALLGAFALAAACSYDFDQYLTSAEFNASGTAGALRGGSGGAANAATGGTSAGRAAVGDGGSAANSEGGEPNSQGGEPNSSGGGGGSSGGGGGSSGGSASNGGSSGSGGGAFDCSAAAGTLFDGHCYFLLGDGAGAGFEWNEARTACSNLGSGIHLVTITSEAEEQFVEATFFPATADRWIGLAIADTNGNPPNSCRLIPASCPFSWVTSEPVSYSKWGAHGRNDDEPNYSGGCVRIQSGSVDWADLDCDDELPALCETS